MTWYVWESSGNSASIHDRLQPVTSYLSRMELMLLTVMVVKSNMYMHVLDILGI